MTKVFCQNCYSITNNVSLSVWDVNSHGRCSKCDSDAVLSPEVVAGAQQAAAKRRAEATPSEDNWPHSPQGGRGKRCLEYNHSFIHKSDIYQMLAVYDTSLEKWWDGHYFQLNYNFLYYYPTAEGACQRATCYSPTLDILLENTDGNQRYITFEVTLAKLEPTDVVRLSEASHEIEP